MATMNDVARRAGVSVSTVSYVLSGARPISKPTRERIERAMAELGYTPNAMARGLKTRRSWIIALLYPVEDFRISPSAAEYVVTASDHAQKRGYHLLLWTQGLNALEDLRRHVSQGLVDGALVMEVRLQDPRLPLLQEVGLPMAMIGHPAAPQGMDFTDCDIPSCAEVAVGLLADLGHSRLGAVTTTEGVLRTGSAYSLRLRDSLRTSAERRGMRLTLAPCDTSFDAGRGAFAQLTRADPEISAVISLNEQALPGLMAAAKKTGRQLPADLSVVAIDIPEWLAMTSTPAITTVGPAVARIAATAVDMLIRRIEASGPDEQASDQRLFPAGVVTRDSTAPCRGR